MFYCVHVLYTTNQETSVFSDILGTFELENAKSLKIDDIHTRFMFKIGVFL